MKQVCTFQNVGGKLKDENEQGIQQILTQLNRGRQFLENFPEMYLLCQRIKKRTMRKANIDKKSCRILRFHKIRFSEELVPRLTKSLHFCKIDVLHNQHRHAQVSFRHLSDVVICLHCSGNRTISRDSFRTGQICTSIKTCEFRSINIVFQRVFKE